MQFSYILMTKARDFFSRLFGTRETINALVAIDYFLLVLDNVHEP